MMSARTACLLGVIALVAAASLFVRRVNDVRLRTGSQDESWASTDPDSLYHMRRLERALEAGGTIAARDPFLAYPDGLSVGGTPIPWPPYYTRFLYAASVWRAPDATLERQALHEYVERTVASWPLVFGVLTSVLAALGAALLASREWRAPAALGAGLYHAFLFGSLRYSHFGMGDHHAWTSMLEAALLLLFGLAARRPRRALESGIAAGLLAGLLIGSWVAGLAFIALLELVFVWQIVRPKTQARRARVRFALAYHLSAACALLPAALASPFDAFELLNLGRFQPALFLAAGAVCVPLLAGRARAAALLVALGCIVGVAVTPIGAELARGLEWASAADRFMGSITESQPLVGPGAGLRLFSYLGLGILILPFAWLHAARAAFAGRRQEWLPWALSIPVLLLMALAQRRFADALGAPLATLLAGYAVALCARRGAPSPRRAGVIAAALALAALCANQGVVRTSWARARGVPDGAAAEFTCAQRAQREMLSWIVEQAGSEAVLAQWDLGHAIEWIAQRPSIATGFGSYLGEKSFLEPWRFFLGTDEGEAEALMEERGARFVFVTEDFERNSAAMWSALRPGEPVDWANTIAAELLPLGARREQGLGFLRRVRGGLAPGAPNRDVHDPIATAGAVYERVAGAWVEVRGAAGETLRVSVEVAGPAGAPVLEWSRSTTTDADGFARVRVPYSTERDGAHRRTAGPLRWTLGEREGLLPIPEAAIRSGEVIRPPD